MKKPKLKIERTIRGFSIAEFTDRYGEKCSLQKSSLAFEDCIWLGIDKPKLTVFADEGKGQYIETVIPETWQVSARMHLTREMVADLLPHLKKFVETGEIE